MQPCSDAFEWDSDLDTLELADLAADQEAQQLMDKAVEIWQKHNDLKRRSGIGVSTNTTLMEQQQLVDNFSDSYDRRTAVASAAYKIILRKARQEFKRLEETYSAEKGQEEYDQISKDL